MKFKLKKPKNKPRKIKGAVLWLTGLSGAGKSMIGDRLSEILQKKGVRAQRLDGNLLKGCFGNKLNFNKKDDHDFNVMVATFVSSILEKHGILVIASFISPYKHQREFVRNASMHFIEVYVNASIDTDKMNIESSVKKVLNYLSKEKYI